jgi:hypothetical protein
MSVCQSCGASVTWVLTEATGKRMPLDPEPVDNGNLQIVASRSGGPVVRYVGQTPKGYVAAKDGPRYVSHFVTCPNAAQHRRA